MANGVVCLIPLVPSLTCSYPILKFQPHHCNQLQGNLTAMCDTHLSFVGASCSILGLPRGTLAWTQLTFGCICIGDGRWWVNTLPFHPLAGDSKAPSTWLPGVVPGGVETCCSQCRSVVCFWIGFLPFSSLLAAPSPVPQAHCFK